MNDTQRDSYDVAVIGRGAAGLNGALLLAQSMRSVVVIDAGAPRNALAARQTGRAGRSGRSKCRGEIAPV
jgi:glycine/D-amino acid oxidase-like deaminating enzyme